MNTTTNSTQPAPSVYCLVAFLAVFVYAQALAQTLIWPVDVPRVTQDYASFGGVIAGKFHTGIDITSAISPAQSTQVLAAGPGKVIMTNNSCAPGDTSCAGGWGNYVVIRHNSGLFSLYAHLASVSVAVGAVVAQGQVIGIMGATGNVLGAHVHFDILTSEPTTTAHFGPGYTTDHPAQLGHPDPRDYFVRIPVRVNNSTVNVHKRPGASEAQVTTIVQGQEFVAIAQSANGWYFIHLPSSVTPSPSVLDDDRYGWVPGSLLLVNPSPAPDQVKVSGARLWEVGATSLGVYSGAGTSFTELTRIWEGQTFVTFGMPTYGVGSSSPWYKIYLPANAGAQEGWVSGDYLAAFPHQFSGGTTGVFVSPDGPTTQVLAGVGTSHFSWGTPVSPSSLPSSLSFAGVTFSSKSSAPFSIGSLTLTNSITRESTQADNVTLRTAFALSSPISSVITQEFLLRLVNTANTNGGSADADIVRLPMAFASRLITNGTQLLGTRLTFGETTDSGFSQPDEFVVLEDRSSTADLRAQFIPAAPITFATSGIFTNPVGATTMVVTGVGTSVFTWGSPTSNRFELFGTNQAGFSEQPTPLANLWYYNGSIQQGTEAASVEVDFSINFPDDALATNLTIRLKLISTQNTNDARANADIVRIVNPPVLPIFRLGGADYALRLGFARPTTNGLSNIEEFAVFENTNATAQIQGVFSRSIVPPPLLALSLRRLASSFLLTWPTQLGRTYQVQASTNLPNFFPVSGVITGMATTIGFEDESTNAQTKFYRVQQFP
jgi:murein DD-endopeptidase MepM/ murein hydrolase activator NlpD